MKPRTFTKQLPQLTMVVVAVACFSAFAPDSIASQPGRIFLRENFSTTNRDQLIAKLRRITGLDQLRFDSNGSLVIGAKSDQRGSQIARSLLATALNGRDLVVFEDASSRADVVFCRVVPGKEVNSHVVLIDFTDFERLIGDKKARESFDVGWGVLHELDHVVRDTEDAAVKDHLGECEKHINEMREELGLPVRADYFYRPTSLRTNPNFRTNFVSLSFEQRDAATGKLKTFLLTWDSEAVGSI